MPFKVSFITHYRDYSPYRTSCPVQTYDHTEALILFESGIEFSRSSNMPQWLYNKDLYDLEDLIDILPEHEALEVVFNLDMFTDIFNYS